MTPAPRMGWGVNYSSLMSLNTMARPGVTYLRSTRLHSSLTLDWDITDEDRLDVEKYFMIRSKIVQVCWPPTMACHPEIFGEKSWIFDDRGRCWPDWQCALNMGFLISLAFLQLSANNKFPHWKNIIDLVTWAGGAGNYFWCLNNLSGVSDLVHS